MTSSIDRMEAPEGPVTHVLAHRVGLGVVLGLLVTSGAMCLKCGYGTRVTSKRWARCKQCGERVERRALANAQSDTPPTEGQPT